MEKVNVDFKDFAEGYRNICKNMSEIDHTEEINNLKSEIKEKEEEINLASEYKEEFKEVSKFEEYARPMNDKIQENYKRLLEIQSREKEDKEKYENLKGYLKNIRENAEKQKENLLNEFEQKKAELEEKREAEKEQYKQQLDRTLKEEEKGSAKDEKYKEYLNGKLKEIDKEYRKEIMKYKKDIVVSYNELLNELDDIEKEYKIEGIDKEKEENKGENEEEPNKTEKEETIKQEEKNEDKEKVTQPVQKMTEEKKQEEPKKEPETKEDDLAEKIANKRETIERLRNKPGVGTTQERPGWTAPSVSVQTESAKQDFIDMEKLGIKIEFNAKENKYTYLYNKDGQEMEGFVDRKEDIDISKIKEEFLERNKGASEEKLNEMLMKTDIALIKTLEDLEEKTSAPLIDDYLKSINNLDRYAKKFQDVQFTFDMKGVYKNKDNLLEESKKLMDMANLHKKIGLNTTVKKGFFTRITEQIDKHTSIVKLYKKGQAKLATRKQQAIGDGNDKYVDGIIEEVIETTTKKDVNKIMEEAKEQSANKKQPNSSISKYASYKNPYGVKAMRDYEKKVTEKDKEIETPVIDLSDENTYPPKNTSERVTIYSEGHQQFINKYNRDEKGNIIKVDEKKALNDSKPEKPEDIKEVLESKFPSEDEYVQD